MANSLKFVNHIKSGGMLICRCEYKGNSYGMGIQKVGKYTNCYLLKNKVDLAACDIKKSWSNLNTEAKADVAMIDFFHWFWYHSSKILELTNDEREFLALSMNKWEFLDKEEYVMIWK